MPLVDPVTMSAPPSDAPTPRSQSQPQPIQLHATTASRAARHMQPVVTAALFVAAFPSLVAADSDPVPVMRNALPVVLVLQALHAFFCLPMAGSGSGANNKNNNNRKPRPGEKKKDSSGPNFVITTLLSALLSLLLAPFLHALMILFGAPLLTHVAHTFLCAAHLSLLGLFPLIYVHGVDPSTWLSLASFQAPLDECFGGLLGAFLGAWLGAVPIPLDWDREWQKWPVTILTGMYAGCLLGRLAGGSLLFGMRFGGKSQ